MNYEADSTPLSNVMPSATEEEWMEQTHRIAVIQEQVQVNKKVIETGVVTIAKRVHEDKQIVDLPVVREEITVERVAINQYVETSPSVRYEGETMIIPVLQEVFVKRLLLVEEVHVIRHRVQTSEPQEVILRKEEVVIDRRPVTADLHETS